LKNRFALVAALTVGVLGVLAIDGSAQSRAKTSRAPAPARGENGLVGIKLYDTGLQVVAKYGAPNEVQSVGAGGGSIGPVGGRAGAGGGGGAAAGAAGGRRGGGGGGSAAEAMGHTDTPTSGFGFGDDIIRLQGVGQEPGDIGPSSVGGQPAPAGASGGGPGRPAGGAGTAGGQDQKILFTRWVYNRSSSKYAFVIDKHNRVVQIEAIGISDSRVKTARGVSFGANFAKLIRTYSAPDGYEINGDTLVVRFLQRNKVAFRLSRLGNSKSHVVTGIVVAGGKT